METVAKRGGFEFKETLMSGDKEDESGEPRKVLGLIWETETDRLKVDVKLNLGAKKAGLHLKENIELSGEPENALPEAVTKRELWRVAQGQYDPLGLLSAFTVRFKILMRNIVGEGPPKVSGWDDPVPEGVNKEFRKVITHLGDLRAITFPRAVKPKEEVSGKPMLLIFGDGSTLASCALAYLRWQMADGTVQCRLLAGKTRVAPKCKITIPRMELMGALLAVRLSRKIQDALQMELEAVRYFTDSAVVLGMVLRESAIYQEFVGTRVSEIRTKSNPETEWFWVPGEMNIADMGTRPTVVPGDMGPGTPYQEGMPWMKEPPETWPTRKTFAPPPPEECKKDMMAMIAVARVKSGLWYPPSASTRAKLERVYGYVYTFLAGARKLASFTPVTRRTRTVKGETVVTHSPPAEQYREAARLCLLRDAQASIEKSRLKGLMIENRTYNVEEFADKEILTLGGRQKNYLRVAYDRGDLPILPAHHLLSRLYLEEAHKADHAGVDAMVMRSRTQVWITQVRPKAKAVKNACFACKRSARRLGEQKMAPLPEHRMGPTPPFFSTAVDLFGPLPIIGSVNKRTTGKAWGVIFVCTSTSLSHVEVAESYSTESFLMAVRRFMALHGAPKRFQSDQGTQLVAASKQLATWDWTAVHEQAERVGAEWHIVPTGGQHYNGQAERLIGLLKRCLEGALNNRKFTLGELSTVVAEAAQVVNSRPIARNTGDPETGGPITPLHLQLGRATVEVPRMRFEEAPRLTQRLQFIEEAKRQFWKKWMQQVFSGRMLNHKWTKSVRNVAVGDIVYLAEAENDDPTYRLGQVVEACPGEDGCVRTVRVRYTNPGKPEGKRSPPKTTTRPIHKVAVVVPTEYVFEDDSCDNTVGSRCPRSDLPSRGKMEAAKAQGKEPAEVKEGEPEGGGVRPAARRRRGRPRKANKPPARKQEIAGAAAEVGDRVPTTRRGQLRDRGPRKQREGGRRC
jgi:transposase InsO family protein